MWPKQAGRIRQRKPLPCRRTPDGMVAKFGRGGRSLGFGWRSPGAVWNLEFLRLGSEVLPSQAIELRVQPGGEGEQALLGLGGGFARAERGVNAHQHVVISIQAQ